MKKQYDVIVIGGGHAGVEAAAASARLGAKTALITFKKEDIGTLSCNPSIGGLGKGHIVREIDALDGVMPGCADTAGIHFRVLNRSKGAAVQGPRAQVDRVIYRDAVFAILSDYPNLDLIFDEVTDLIDRDGAIVGVETKDHSQIDAKAVILTTGTFLRGLMHTGEEQSNGGRVGDAASYGITPALTRLGFETIRLKTGTPARLDGDTINWDVIDTQASDEHPEPFSMLTESVAGRDTITCGMTSTNEEIHQLIRDGVARSPLFNGQIDGKGPRYCPSIEDKVVRFPHHHQHNVFLEPEGLNTNVVYPNGISTSLPKDIQDAVVKRIKGCEHAKILQYGYAIEYDAIDARMLKPTLESHAVKGLFFAGQINGTSGYEEAAGQGVVAGINAAHVAQQKEAFILSRTESYIGVLIDDITTLGVDEPYRMFTARSEYRLMLRADNADQRLTPRGLAIGLIRDARRDAFESKQTLLHDTIARMKEMIASHKKLVDAGLQLNHGGEQKNAYRLFGFPNVDFKMIETIFPSLATLPDAIKKQIEIEGKYEGYLSRVQHDIDSIKRDEQMIIPDDFNYAKVGSLTNEVVQKLTAAKPATLAAAARIQGITPAALIAVLKSLKKKSV